MNICDVVKTPSKGEPLFVAGRLYKWTEIYLATSEGTLVQLTTGKVYDHQSKVGCSDVTDQYCLKKV